MKSFAPFGLLICAVLVAISAKWAFAQNTEECGNTSSVGASNTATIPRGIVPTRTDGSANGPFRILVVFAQYAGDSWDESNSVWPKGSLPIWAPYFVNPLKQHGTGTVTSDGLTFIPSSSTITSANVGGRIYIDNALNTIIAFNDATPNSPTSIAISPGVTFVSGHTYNYQCYDQPYSHSLTEYCDLMSLKKDMVVGEHFPFVVTSSVHPSTNSGGGFRDDMMTANQDILSCTPFSGQ